LTKKKDKELIKKLVRQGSMLDAAQVIRDGSIKADLTAELRNIFQIRPTPYHDLYQDLLLMDPKVIVTTNYDEFLEKNFEHYSRGSEAHSICKHKSNHLLNDLRSPIRSIVKIHGCITEASDVVLDRSSYFDARRNNQGLFQTVSALMMVNTVFFLGYSLSDPDIQLILGNIHLYSKCDNTHYAVMSRFEHNAIKNANVHSYNVDFLEYPTGDHAAVPRLLANLKEQVLEERRRRGIV
jgi:NAD-dependent SIR2 family protein deacetylase